MNRLKWIFYETEITALISSLFSTSSGNFSRARFLRLLCWIRLFALLGQTSAILYAQLVLKLEMSYPALWAVMVGLTGLSIYSWLQSGKSKAVSERAYGLNIGVEIAGFSLLMYLSGGATNPFVFYYLVPLSIGVATLKRSNAWALTGLCISVYTLLMFEYQYLALFDMSHGMSMSWNSPHILGMWMNFVVSALLITYFVSRMADQIRSQERELADRDQKQREDEHLLAMGTFAAGTAHELGTPLSSLAIILQDLSEQTRLSEEQQAELKVAYGEVGRCRTILHSLVTAAQSSQTASDAPVLVGDLLDSLQNQARNLFPEAEIYTQLAPDLSDKRVVSDNALVQSLLNLYANAIEAGQTKSAPQIEVQASCSDSYLRIDIRDHGSGVDSDIQSRLGRMLVSDKPEGLGMGYFLANASINRIGGNLSITNRTEGGAETVIELPLHLSNRANGADE